MVHIFVMLLSVESTAEFDDNINYFSLIFSSQPGDIQRIRQDVDKRIQEISAQLQVRNFLLLPFHFIS